MSPPNHLYTDPTRWDDAEQVEWTDAEQAELQEPEAVLLPSQPVPEPTPIVAPEPIELAPHIHRGKRSRADYWATPGKT